MADTFARIPSPSAPPTHQFAGQIGKLDGFVLLWIILMSFTLFIANFVLIQMSCVRPMRPYNFPASMALRNAFQTPIGKPAFVDPFWSVLTISADFLKMFATLAHDSQLPIPSVSSAHGQLLQVSDSSYFNSTKLLLMHPYTSPAKFAHPIDAMRAHRHVSTVSISAQHVRPVSKVVRHNSTASRRELINHLIFRSLFNTGNATDRCHVLYCYRYFCMYFTTT